MTTDLTKREVTPTPDTEQYTVLKRMIEKSPYDVFRKFLDMVEGAELVQCGIDGDGLPVRGSLIQLTADDIRSILKSMSNIASVEQERERCASVLKRYLFNVQNYDKRHMYTKDQAHNTLTAILKEIEDPNHPIKGGDDE